VLLKAVIASLVPLPDADRPEARQVREVEASQAAALGRLYCAVHPDCGQEVAEDTYRRWSADERFISGGLLAVPGPGGELLAAALMYPLIHTSPQEPPEALLADLLLHPDADRKRLAGPLIAAVTAAGARHDARVARAVVAAADHDLLADLHAMGLRPVEEIRYYRAPPPAAL
jgi:hypothetical protein